MFLLTILGPFLVNKNILAKLCIRKGIKSGKTSLTACVLNSVIEVLPGQGKTLLTRSDIS